MPLCCEAALSGEDLMDHCLSSEFPAPRSGGALLTRLARRGAGAIKISRAASASSVVSWAPAGTHEARTFHCCAQDFCLL